MSLRFVQGHFGETVGLYQDRATRFPAMPVFRAGLAAALAEAGQLDQARVEAERLAADDLATLPKDPTWSLTLDQPERALRRFEHAAELAGRMQARPMVAMSLEGQARALLALNRPGDHTRAAGVLTEAAAYATRQGLAG